MRHRGRFIARFTAFALTITVTATIPLVAGAAGADGSLARRLHNGPGIINHPVNIRPSSAVRIPQGWPLSSSGLLTCRTCHTVLPRFGDRAEPRLRDANTHDPAGFCAQCHSPGDTGAAHWTAMTRAHLSPAEVDPIGGSALDIESRRCLTCHDGVSAPDAHHGRATASPASFANRGRNHPIGVHYGRSMRVRRGNTPLRPASLLPVEVRLPGGQVSCVSCHNLFNPDRYHLTVPIEGSALCFTCHDIN